MYKSTQIGWVVIFIVLLLMTFLAFTVNAFVLKLCGAICLLVILLCYKLTITIDNHWIRFSMGIGLISGKFNLINVVDCKTVDYLPLGWGVRFRPGKIIYNVSGSKALELTLKNRNVKVLLGSDNPETLMTIIREIKRKQQPQ